MRRFAILVLAALLSSCHGAAGSGDGGLLDDPAGRVTFDLRAAATSKQPPTFTVTACFWNGALPVTSSDGGGPVCRGTVIAGCCVSDVDPGLDRQGCLDENLDVGPVQILVNGRAAGTLALKSGSYLLPAGATLAWKAGDSLEARGGGQGGFPAFDVKVAAAAPPALSQPQIAYGNALFFARSRTLLFAWPAAHGASSSEAWISATAPQSGDLASADCVASGDPGRATFDTSALQELPAGLGTASVAREIDAPGSVVTAVSRSAAEVAVQTQ